MSGLALTCLLISGCVSTLIPSTSTANLAAGKQSQEIAQSAERCRKAAMERAESEAAIAAAMPEVFSTLVMQEAIARGEQSLALCKAAADRKNDELARSESAAYRRAAERERDFAAFMAQLTASMGR
jgi:hypothetical protein